MSFSGRMTMLAFFFTLFVLTSPMQVFADIFGNEIVDVYATLTENVRDTNEILGAAFEFSQISPYDVVNTLTGTNQGSIAIAVHTATSSLALTVAVLLLMVVS
jgi:hypothetical protein